MLQLDTLFDQFIQEKLYVKNLSPNTIEFFNYSYKAFRLIIKDKKVNLNKQILTNFIFGLKQKGKTTGAINAYIRGFNSFLSWLYENEHTKERFSLKQLKQEKKVMKTFSDIELKKIINWKPRTFPDQRLHAILCLLIDTGCRIDEALGLKREDVNFDQLIIKVMGKGNKERVVPISIELRKVIYKFMQRHKFELVFPSLQGEKLLYDNTRRDFCDLMAELKIENFDGAFHAFRRKFARSYVKNGGNLFYLMKALGHTTLTMSKKYCEVDEQDLKETHVKVSLLKRLK